MQLYDSTGRPIALGREIGRGGEGAVLDVLHDPTSVAKVYHDPVAPEKVAKLQAMAAGARPELLQVAAWPTGTLHARPRGELRGILLPKVLDHREIHQLYGPIERKIHFPRADWSFLIHVAMNCAAAFETIHQCGHVVGDVNQSGVLVSARGTVRLIDCDSFQIRQNGRLFRCVVGVPQYTPPELQGRSFGNIERTSAHDDFGLALIIFHLLFMGRHPFAGRFIGSGDMPIERAIVEGRFAFSKYGQSYQMMPPPHALPLDALPQRIASNFERAFSRPQHGLTRPTAAEWRTAMAELKQAVRTCPSDRGHVYPSNLAACPWCEVMRHGGPNFFISVQFAVDHVQLELPYVDFYALWRRIEMVPPPNASRPVYPPSITPPTPTPLPEEVLVQRHLLTLVRAVTLFAVFVAVAGAFIHELLVYVGLVLTILFAAAWAATNAASGYRRELRRRRADAAAKRKLLQKAQQEWDDELVVATSRFNEMVAGLARVKDQAVRIRPEFEREKQELEAKRREDQLEDYLERHFIRNYRIRNIGPGRLATLLSYGIETAADVDRKRLRGIPGFGPSTITEMVSWRHTIARGFVFDPTKPAPADKIRVIVMKYQQLQQTCQATLTAGAEQLQGLNRSTTARLAQTAGRIQALVTDVRQAEADLEVR